MNQTQTRGGPNLGLLLAIPAVVIIAKAAMHRRGYGHHRFAGTEGEMGPRAFRLPPRIEAALDAWHTRSHEGSDMTKPEQSPDEA